MAAVVFAISRSGAVYFVDLQLAFDNYTCYK